MRKDKRFLAIMTFFLLAPCLAEAAWQATWVASPQKKASLAPAENQTIRSFLHFSRGGSKFQLRFSNLWGTAPLKIDGIHAAMPDGQGGILVKTDKPILFSGSETVTIPAGQEIWSDPLEMIIADGGDLVLSMYFQAKTGLDTQHVVAASYSQFSPPGNSLSENFTSTRKEGAWFFVSEIDVDVDQMDSVIVAFGDSITDGVGSTWNANHRWPNFLYPRLAPTKSVVDAGIAFNKVLTDQYDGRQPSISAQKRFTHDALQVAGVTHVILFEGINDIGLSADSGKDSLTAEDVIDGYRQLISAAHAKGLKVIGATLTPDNGSGYFTANKEKIRQTVNQWLRLSSMLDGHADFDLATRDPQDPTRLRKEMDSGDHLHPNDAAYAAMAEVIDTQLFNNETAAP